ncbi:MAG: flagellar assembly protein FliH [Acidihalobacter sp.]|jgi:flagellar assembly protein FliH
MRSKVLSDQETEEVSLWRAPSMETVSEHASLEHAHEEGGVDDAETHAELLRPMTAEQLEAVQESARQEGFRQGREEGLAAGAEEARQKSREWASLLDAAARPLEDLDRQVVEELMALAVAVSRQIVRRELQAAPDEIIRVIREALAVLPSQSGDVRVELHPQDAALVRELMPEGEGERAWRIVEDPALDRGGCRISSEVSRVDATVERRLNQAIAAALGDMRGGGDA